MLLLAVVAQFEIARPTTPVGWVILAIVGFVVLTIVGRGIKSVVSQTAEQMSKIFWVLVAIALILLFPTIVASLQSDPLLRTDTEVFPNAPAVDGTVQLNGSDGSADHSHDSSN